MGRVSQEEWESTADQITVSAPDERVDLERSSNQGLEERTAGDPALELPKPNTAGAPLSRFLQGRVRCRLYEFAHGKALYEKFYGAWRVPQIELMIG
jgi:hypothetical protein